MTGQPTDQVQRQRQDFQRDEHGQQVVGGGEHHHAADRQHHQREEFGLGGSGPLRFALGVAARNRGGLRGKGIQPAADCHGHLRAGGLYGAFLGGRAFRHEDDCQHRDQQHGALQEQRHWVDGYRAQHRGATRPNRLGHKEQRDEGRDQTAKCQCHLRAVPKPSRHERFDEDADHGDPEDDEHRGQQKVLDAGSGEGHRCGPSAGAGAALETGRVTGLVTLGAGSCWPMVVMVFATAGLIRSNTGLG